MIHIPVTSSNIKTVGHEGNTMQVTFKHGGTYEYPDVDKAQFDRMLNAESLGKFLKSWGVKGVKLQEETP